MIRKPQHNTARMNDPDRAEESMVWIVLNMLVKE